MDEIDSVIRSEGRESQPPPLQQILRNGQGDPGAERGKRSVGHHIALQRLDEDDARIFAAATAIRATFIISFRLERNAEPFNFMRIAIPVELHSGNADARIITPRNEPREKIKMTIGTAGGGRIQDAFDLLRITGLRLHDLS